MIRVGVDLVELAGFRAMLEREPSIISEIFTESELGYTSQFGDPAPRLAARFAAKEATMKALGVGIDAVEWREIGIVRDDLGSPFLVITGSARELADRLGLARWVVSLSHSESVAMSVVVAEG
jgi:holo-[acyl-carrier protein] synthase